MSDRLSEIEQHSHLVLREEDLHWLVEEIRRLRFWITEARALYANMDVNSAPLLEEWMDRGETRGT